MCSTTTLGAFLPFNPDDSSAIEIISMSHVRVEDGDTKQLAQGHMLISEGSRGTQVLPSGHAPCTVGRVCPFPFHFGLKRVEYLIVA